jgi:hypothetical protein
MKTSNLTMCTTICHLQSSLLFLHICTLSVTNYAYQRITLSHSTKPGDPWAQGDAFVPSFYLRRLAQAERIKMPALLLPD